MRIDNPKIPNSWPIDGGLRPGVTLYFKGKVADDVNRFAINLKIGGHIAMHFNPRFRGWSGVVFNTRKVPLWQKEERTSQPFQKGGDFELLFIVKKEGYQVNVNGEELHLYKHRMPLENVKTLQCVGNVSFETIIIGEGGRLGSTLSIPHLQTIEGGLKTGMSVYFKGLVHKDIRRFKINLKCGNQPRCDKALHFNPRFQPQQVVVFNSFRNRRWEREERPAGMPFSRGEIFELLFIVTSEGYQVKVNENAFYLFKHRIPVEQVTHIKIGGDVSIQTVDITEAADADLQTCVPAPVPVVCIPPPPPPPVLPTMEIDSGVNPIYGGLRAGMSVYFKGTAPKDSNRFSLNLFCGHGKNNAFHFNPRFDTDMVVFNSRRDGTWENEERPSGMPLSRGEEFEILYIITSEGYQVNVNGKPFYLFKHRRSVEDVTAINVCGEVGITTINIIRDGEGGLQGSLTQGKTVLPSIPHMTTIPGGLKVGMHLHFRGIVHNTIKRFHINLQNGQKKGRGIALHFNPRFKPGQVVVLNSFMGSWKKEERIHEMPFRRGESFELVFIVTEKGYLININGHQFYLFKHRMPAKNVNVLKIVGDVSMEYINIIAGGQESSQGLRKMRINKIPHVGPILGGLSTGTYMYFRGTVPKDSNRFSFNLQYGQMKGSDKALHFNPRFKPSEVVVFNSFQNGKWENEERVNKMPFRQGEDFEVLFIITAIGYQVLINGRHFYLFKHRMPVEHVSAVKIAGEVSMKTVNMIRGVQGALDGHPSLGRILATKIPHVGPIFGGLRSGMALFFRGTVPQDIKRFHINLQLGNMKGSDKALHFNPRFEPTEVVVMNSYRNGTWENEERPSEMPFSKGEDFELAIIITAEGFQLNVNGRQFYLFKHRMPVEHVNVMKIAGDVTMQTVNITEAGKISLKHPGLGKMVVNSVPFVGPISGGLRTGMYMYFRGKVNEEIDRFHINLQCAEKKGCNKALHFNPRFKGGQVVVFNSFQNGQWKREERVHQMPFQKGEDFELVFIVTPKGYQVIVNGRPLYLFKHRIAVEHVTAVKIAGDVSMEFVNLIGGGQALAAQRKIAVTSIPHVGPIFGGLRTGVFMFFRGTVPQDIDRFAINLQYGEVKGCDKALHFNPRFKPTELVVFNSYRQNKWENEERVHEMPFRKGEDFEMAIMVTPKGYQVIINGRQFYLFKHRMPVEHVTALKIGGDVSMQDVNMIGGEDDDQEGRPQYGRLAISKIPHVGPILCGLKTGIALQFSGTVPNHINRFHINLQFGEKDGSDIALHFNPRFKPFQVVVFNSFRKGRWEKEERPSEMPFRRGEDFHLVFLITSEGYQVFVNGKKFHLFKHRMPAEQVNGLKIAGDVTMETVDINEGEDDILRRPGQEVLSIPHLKPIPDSLEPGMSVFVKGKVPSKCNRFSVNLLCGEKPGSDNALHVNPRLNCNLVVFNTCQNGRWESEERPSEMPFKRGEDFKMFINVTSEGYQVNVNGSPFHLFKHRRPVEDVKAIWTVGDVSLYDVDIIKEPETDLQICPSPQVVVPPIKPAICGPFPMPEICPLGPFPIPRPAPPVKKSIPRVGPFHGGLRAGTSVVFRGTVPEKCGRFSINLCCGLTDDCDNAFHFNPRFQSNVVVFNTFRDNKWENEERPSGMPLSRGEDFELVYIVTSEGYQVNVNGNQFYLFKHRIPLEQVRTIKIVPDVMIHSVNIIEGGEEGKQGQLSLGRMVFNTIPFKGPISGGLRNGMYLYFRGAVHDDINRFHINLQCGDEKGCDKALHFNPRFRPNEMVVFNTFRKNRWRKEERVHEMPFRKGESFELVFIVTAKGYQVLVNGRLFYMFKHRIPLKHVSDLVIAGDVSMENLKIFKGGRRGVQGYEGQRTISLPKIPHVAPLYGGLRSGMRLSFKGSVPKEIKRFCINLQYGQVNGSDIALHFNPRFEPTEVVVFNSYRHGKWENEERPSEMPFRKGEDFELVFILTSEGYQVNVNGKEFYLFKHRMPLGQVSALKVAGDVSMETAEITEEAEEEPEEEKEEKEEEAEKEEKEEREVVPSISHVGPIYGGLMEGMSLHFSATIPEDAKRFSINLYCGDDDGCDNAFHFNPRFDSTDVVVFNTNRNGNWENEERVEDMPFMPGDSFELVFIVTSEGYQVNVNGKEFYLFKHRMPLENVTTIKVFQDVFIRNTNIIERGKGRMMGRLSQAKMVVASLPFVEPLRRNLRAGTYLYFRGKIDDDINRFHINLQNGDMKGAAKVLHFNPRFQPSQVVVFNTFQNGRWGKEERVNVMPFRKGENFELIFIVTAKGYQVIVNGRRFYMYKHRIPLEQVNVLKIAGDVSMDSIDMTEGGVQRYRGLNKMAVTKIPYVGPVSEGLRPGMYLYFRGTVPEDIKRFHINLQYGQTHGCDKALHFNPRFDPTEVVVFNSYRNGTWQKEERPSEMPFRKGEDFELLFIITAEGFQVNVNGRQFYLFKHRMPVEYVSAIKIAGDVSIKTFNTIGGGEGGLQPRLGKMVVPSIPHVGPVFGGLRPGTFVTFSGTVPEDVKRFSFNLQFGQMSGCDNALHFNPRFDQEEVVFNTFRNNAWENEERVDKMPFTKGEKFEVVFMIISEGYQVYVNGHHFYLFKHRMPVEQVSAIRIVGDVSMDTVNMTETGKGAPTLPPPGPVSTTPHVEPIPGQLRTGMYLYFKGTVTQEAKRFHINLQNGEITGCDIALHLNPRFEPTEVVVFNTHRGNWENEERPTDMPFSKGEDFELVIIVTKEGYQVNVNGREFYLYKHRMPVEEVSTVKIDGDVSIETFEMIEAGPEQPSLGKTVISTIPHVVPTYGGLRQGMYLYFKGTVPEEIKRFHINLQYGQRKGSNKALHFNPRFDPTEVVVFNSFRDGSWEEEERPSEMPFRKGEDFELLIFITSVGFQVNVNGRRFHLFKHRMPVEHVSAIKIAGDVSMKNLNMVEGGESVEESVGQGKIQVATIPHVGPIYGGLRPGMALFFQGTVPEAVERFHINLQYGQMKGCDKAFHFNPRFEPSPGVVVFNSFQNGSWEKEERVNKMPFTPGENFELAFIITLKGYKVIVNGSKFYFFKHRMPVEQVSALKISGSTFIQSLNIIKAEDVDIKKKPDEEEEPEGGDAEDQEKEPEGGDAEAEEKPTEKEEEPERGDDGTEEQPAEKDKETESLPEEEVVSGDLKEGMAVYFKGTVPNELSSFAVNLRCGDAEDSNIALHFNAQFEPSEKVLFNSFKDGSWETEETVTEMPFRRGESFELVFHVLSEGYQVWVNRHRFYLFKHRMSVESVTSVRNIGDVHMQVANFIDIGQMPVTKEPEEDAEISHIMMSIPGSLKAGLSMSFQGTVSDDCSGVGSVLLELTLHKELFAEIEKLSNEFDECFSINLLCGETNGCDTAIHFNPRFDTSEVVFNSFRDGSWETEEKVTEMPFTKGKSFLLVFMLKEDGYQVNVNGSPLHMFKHRMPLEEVRSLKIIGDVSIENVNIVEIVEEGIEVVTETIQCETALPGALKVGTSITFPGTIPAETKSFSINLQCGDTDGCDTAFRFSPQFETSEVVFNSFQNGSWGTEEKVDKMLFTQGEEFELVYIVTEEGYQVNVNGTELYLFKHRISVEQVKILQITGDVSISTINLAEGADQEQSPTDQGTVQAEIPIPDCLKAWVTLAFEGMVPADADRFCINLQCGDTEGSDTAFHFNAQLDTSEVVFNSFRDGSWGTEEKAAEMPFSKGENFEMSYVISLDGYQVKVNGKELHFFPHRIPVQGVTTLQIIGSVAIMGISITECAPSVTPLPSGLQIGSSLVFQGSIPNDSSSFSIDLQVDETEDCDKVFQFHPQFEPSEAVVFNSFQELKWGEEERIAEAPFHRGEDFELVYLITAEGYQVNVNGQKFHMFKHRIPVEQVKALLIAGYVSVPSLSIIEGGASVEETSSVERTIGAPLMVPFPDGFKAGTTMNLLGFIPEGISGFTMDLQCGEADGSDIALHFNPQFEPSEVVLFNSFKNGEWETEERVEQMPFARGGKLDLHFTMTSEGYQVKVGDTELHTFRSNIPLEQVTAMKIVGNVSVESITIVEGGADSGTK